MAVSFYSRFIPEEEPALLRGVLESGLVTGGESTRSLQSLFLQRYQVRNLFLMPSCSHALEAACQLLELKPGDEVILPSYNFPSAANAVLLAGGTPVLCDIEPDTQTLSLRDVADKLTRRTRAVIAVHYAGISCDLDTLSTLCEQAGVSLIEDAAQAVDSFYKDRALGTVGRFGAYSFHYTKNFSCGEGGALVCKDSDRHSAEVFQNKGTNRNDYLSGVCDRYTWVGKGSSPIMSELGAAVLLGQMQHAQEIAAKRMAVVNAYHASLELLEMRGMIRRMCFPGYARPNGHFYYVRFPDTALRDRVIAALLAQGIDCRTHYVPLHISPMGKKLGYGEDACPESRAAYETLLRLPVHTGMKPEDASFVSEQFSKAAAG
ncbi:dTDP-4-amino-4,6-dideoxygalactose transaminase [Marasmitruncus massiliensis]|uniref:dTDP-4-amino-4,6-dideoxygalactose transaminase n=1 Tax=Marasmitruncus massiliensis TaxID=1944642 RepID=UPI0015E0997F|nr:dTDP-4-amino-4,6-dideoxygalactose transaminase [Marasmitruncus massiliensis]